MLGLDIIGKLEKANEELTEQLSEVKDELIELNCNMETLIELQREALELRRKADSEE